MVMDNTVLFVTRFKSVTVVWKKEGPTDTGVPLIMPVLEFMTSPPGSAPEVMLHEYGSDPPEACMMAEYADPIAPSERMVVSISTAHDLVAKVVESIRTVMAAISNLLFRQCMLASRHV